MTRRLRLSDDRRAILVRELQAHFHDQHGETIGDLKADLMIDFFLEHLGPPVYNQAIADARQFVQERIDDLVWCFRSPPQMFRSRNADGCVGPP